MLTILLVHLYELSIVLVGQTSLRGHVDDEDALLSFENVSKSCQLVSFDVLGGDVEEGLVLVVELVLALLLHCLEG